MSAGIVKTTPPATDSPADPIVCTMLFSRIVEPPIFFSTEIASTAIGIEALTVRPARRPRYTVDAPNSNPNSTPITIAFAVNSAGDCVARMYGWSAGGGAVIAMAGILTWCFCYNRVLPCENSEQSRTDAVDGDLDAQARATEPRSGVRAYDEPPLGVPALPQHARRRG